MTKELWPVMLTPFTEDGSVDYNALARLIEWYEERGVFGLFSICQSSELFYLSLRERIEIASFVKKRAHVPVIASGHSSCSLADQLDELRAIADSGVDSVILITNRLAEEGSSSSLWLENLHYLLSKLNGSIKLGLYECPYPYKRLITDDELSFCASSGRFFFLKDTCLNLETIKRRLSILEGSNLKLYNAHTTTLLDSLHLGAAGFSGIMANFHPEVYAWLLAHEAEKSEQVMLVQSILTLCSLIESQLYPVNAKYFLKTIGLPFSLYTRSKNHHLMSTTFQNEIDQMTRLIEWAKHNLLDK